MICAILATISIAAIGFFMLGSFWFWICWEILAGGMVTIGCAGEWYLFKNPAAKEHEDEHRAKELRFILLVAMGVTMEWCAMPRTIIEGVKLEQSNLVLRSNVVALEKAYAWRKITKEQQATMISQFNKVSLDVDLSTNPVAIFAESTDAEAVAYGRRIVEVLKSFGINAALTVQLTGRGIPLVGLLAQANVELDTNGDFRMKGNAAAIISAFASVKIPLELYQETNMAAGDIIINVGHKAEK